MNPQMSLRHFELAYFRPVVIWGPLFFKFGDPVPGDVVRFLRILCWFNRAGGGKLMTLNAHIRKEEISNKKNLSSYLKKIEGEEQNKSKLNRRNEIKVTEINEIENRKQ